MSAYVCCIQLALLHRAATPDAARSIAGRPFAVPAPGSAQLFEDHIVLETYYGEEAIIKVLSEEKHLPLWLKRHIVEAVYLSPDPHVVRFAPLEALIHVATLLSRVATRWYGSLPWRACQRSRTFKANGIQGGKRSWTWNGRTQKWNEIELGRTGCSSGGQECCDNAATHSGS